MITDNLTTNTTERFTLSHRIRTRRASAVLAAIGAILLAGGAAAGADAPDNSAAAAPTTAPAAAPTTRPSFVTDGLGADGGLSMIGGRTRVLTTRSPFKRISIAQPDIADAAPLGPTSILVTAKKPGSTQLIIWDDQDHSEVIDVIVDLDLAAVRRQIKTSFPDSNITADALNDSISLRGQVPSAQAAEQLIEMVSVYGKVHNFVEVSGGRQVMLHVKFAEVTKNAEKDLGVNFGGTDGISIFGDNAGGPNALSFLGGGATPLLLAVPTTPTATGTLFGTGSFGHGNALAYLIKVLRENGSMRILAEPNVMAISGQQATFIAGGEIPIPVAQGGNSGISVEYHEYGIQLNFTPFVLGDGKIRLKVNPEVSQLDYANAVAIGGSLVPAFTKQSVVTTVELADGQSFSLAGLLNNQVNTNTNAIPLLADIPILGTLFRSTTYQRNETELVVLVTPQLVEAMNPGEVPTLPGERWRFPNEAQLYLGGDQGGPLPDAPRHNADLKRHGAPPQFHGAYGFTPQTAAPAAAPTAPNTPAAPAASPAPAPSETPAAPVIPAAETPAPATMPAP